MGDRHHIFKFKNNTEKTFAIILERDKEVIKWMRPNLRQFNIYYDRNNSSRYQHDFIVETADCIYMIETKDRNRLNDIDVVSKAKAGTEYCLVATKFNKQNGGKPWEYALIAHDEVRLNSSFHNMVINDANTEQESCLD